MMDPAIETLMEKVSSRFALVTVSARRARQINSYFNQLGEGLGAIVPPQVASVSRKPLSIALEEIVSEKITHAPAADGPTEGPMEREGGAEAAGDAEVGPVAVVEMAGVDDEPLDQPVEDQPVEDRPVEDRPGGGQG